MMTADNYIYFFPLPEKEMWPEGTEFRAIEPENQDTNSIDKPIHGIWTPIKTYSNSQYSDGTLLAAGKYICRKPLPKWYVVQDVSGNDVYCSCTPFPISGMVKIRKSLINNQIKYNGYNDVMYSDLNMAKNSFR